MSRIRGKNTGPELALRRALWAAGIRGYRLHHKSAGNADIAFISKRIAVFVDGCFWHGCPIHGSMPRTNSEFWSSKIKKNKARDQLVDRKLESSGWRVMRFWEHQVTDNVAWVVRKIEKALAG